MRGWQGSEGDVGWEWKAGECEVMRWGGSDGKEMKGWLREMQGEGKGS